MTDGAIPGTSPGTHLLSKTELPQSEAVQRRHTAMAPPRLDMDEYRPAFARYDLTQDEADELICILWDLMVTFVDLGLGLDPVQRILSDEMLKSLADSESVASLKTGFSDVSSEAQEDGDETTQRERNL